MRTLDLALKDLQQILRDKRSLVFLLFMPIVFTIFFGFIFGAQQKGEDPRLKIAVVNHDSDGLLSLTLLDMLNGSDTIRPVVFEAAEESDLDAQIIKGELAAGLVIPEGFSANTLSGQSTQLVWIINEESDHGQTVRRALQTLVTRLVGAAQTAELSAQAYESQQAFSSPSARQAYLEDAVRRAAQAWDSPALVLSTNKSAAAQEAKEKSDPLAKNVYNQFSPGMLVMFAMFGLMQAALVMVSERKNGAMARLLTTPMTKAELIGGHILGMFIVFFGQQAILVTFGALVLKVEYFRQPLALLLVMVSFSVWVAALGLLISTLAKKEDQVVLFAMVAMFLFSALGGSWFTLEMVGKAFAAIGHLTPTAWAIDGFQNLIVRGLGLEAVLLPVGIILAYAAAFFGIAVWKFRFE